MKVGSFKRRWSRREEEGREGEGLKNKSRMVPVPVELKGEGRGGGESWRSSMREVVGRSVFFAERFLVLVEGEVERLKRGR